MLRGNMTKDAIIKKILQLSREFSETSGYEMMTETAVILRGRLTVLFKLLGANE